MDERTVAKRTTISDLIARRRELDALLDVQSTRILIPRDDTAQPLDTVEKLVHDCYTLARSVAQCDVLIGHATIAALGDD